MAGDANQRAQRGAIAAEVVGGAAGIFTAAAAANAIPVAGQFISAGLALAGMFIKIFAGRKAKKKAEKRAKESSHRDKIEGTVSDNVPKAPSAGGVPQQSILPGATVQAQAPSTPMFQGGGGTEPSTVTQQALNNRLGF